MKAQLRGLRNILILIGLLVPAAVAAYSAYRALSRDDAPLEPITVPLTTRDFTLVIPAIGELQSEESLAIAVPPVPIYRLRMAWVVPDGRRIQKGDLLVEFDPMELDLQAMEHRSSLEMAEQRILRGELAVSIERTDIIKDQRLAELELAKINEFMPRDESIYSRSEIIEGELDRSFVQKKIVFAEARFTLKGKVYSLDEAILMLEKQEATARIDRTERALASLKLISPASGIVVYNDPGYSSMGSNLPGRVVWVGMNLFNLVNPEKMQAKCWVLEKDAGELRPGQAVRLKLDPYPDRAFTGKVLNIDKVARAIDRGSPVKYFQTIVTLDQLDPERMKPGVKLKAKIQAGELKSVIVVPRSAVVRQESGQVVYLKNGMGRFEPAPVQLGQGDQVQVVVTEGLSVGQLLALNPPDVQRK